MGLRNFKQESGKPKEWYFWCKASRKEISSSLFLEAVKERVNI